MSAESDRIADLARSAMDDESARRKGGNLNVGAKAWKSREPEIAAAYLVEIGQPRRRDSLVNVRSMHEGQIRILQEEIVRLHAEVRELRYDRVCDVRRAGARGDDRAAIFGRVPCARGGYPMIERDAYWTSVKRDAAQVARLPISLRGGAAASREVAELLALDATIATLKRRLMGTMTALREARR